MGCVGAGAARRELRVVEEGVDHARAAALGGGTTCWVDWAGGDGGGGFRWSCLRLVVRPVSLFLWCVLVVRCCCAACAACVRGA